MSTMLETNELMAFVEFDSKGHPYSVRTHQQTKHDVMEREYSFVMSKKYGLLYSFAGSSRVSPIEIYPSVNRKGKPVATSYWALPILEVEAPPSCRRLEALPDDYSAERLFDIYRVIECSRIIYCYWCKDYMSELPEDLCEHCWWCTICSEISKPGERCRHTRKQSQDA